MASSSGRSRIQSDAAGNSPPGLLRRVGLISAGCVIVADMVGSGIFTTSGFIMQMLGNAWWLLACWLIGAAITLAGALSYGELGARLPKAGGEYVFLRESFGPVWAFLSGWVSLVVGFSAPIAAAAVAAAGYLLQAIPGTRQEVLLSAGSLTISLETLLALGFLGAFTLLHTRRLGIGLGVQNILTLFKILVLLVLILAGMWLWPDESSWSAIAFSGPQAPSVGAVATALVFVSFAYTGFNAAAYLGGEIKNPSRNLPRALLLGTVLVALLYVLLNLAYLAALGPEGMPGVKEIAALAAKALLGPWAGRAMSIAICICLLSAMGAMVLAGPRVYYAMARDGLLLGALGRIDPKSGVPGNAILLQSLIAAVMIVSASFDALLFYIGFTLSLIAALAVAGLFVLRRKEDSPPPFKVPGYPFTPLIFIAANLAMVVFSLTDNPWRGLPSGITLAVGLVLYWFLRDGPPRRRTNHSN
jgi:APA family basic amino acid/polyamine antiporter